MRILVVDDDAGMRQALGSTLEANIPDASVCYASSAVDATTVLDTEPIDLVITDVAMEHDRAGWQLAHRARERKVPVLVLSARDDASEIGELDPVPLISKRELTHLDLRELVACVLATQSPAP